MRPQRAENPAKAERERAGRRVRLALSGRAITAAERETTGSTFLRYTEDGNQRRIEVLMHRGRPAATTITRKPDGTLEIKKDGVSPKDARPELDPMEVRHRPMDEAMAKLLYHAVKGTKKPGLALSTHHESATEQALREAASEIVERCWEPGHTPTGGKTLKPSNLTSTANGLIRSKLTNQDASNMAKKLFSLEPGRESPKPTMNEYNFAVLNHSTMGALTRDNPGLARFYCNRYARLQGTPAAVEHPGEAIRRMREDLNMSNAEWKAFCRVGPDRLLYSRYLSNTELREAARLIKQVNRPTANPERTAMVALLNELHRRFRNGGQDDGWAWKAWVHTLNQFLAPDNTPEPTRAQLANVADALAGHMAAAQPWGKGNWHALWERSERWHRAFINARRLRSAPKTQELTWKSLLNSTEINGLNFKPVESAAELKRLGKEMNNCLETYTTRCHTNLSRIFICSNKDGDTIAVQLARSGNLWTVGQTEGPERRPPGEDVNTATPALRDRYQAAHEAAGRA